MIFYSSIKQTRSISYQDKRHRAEVLDRYILHIYDTSINQHLCGTVAIKYIFHLLLTHISTIQRATNLSLDECLHKRTLVTISYITEAQDKTTTKTDV